MSKPTTVKEAIKNFETEKGVVAANEEKVRDGWGRVCASLSLMSTRPFQESHQNSNEKRGTGTIPV
jgi:hypothetical protein